MTTAEARVRRGTRKARHDLPLLLVDAVLVVAAYLVTLVIRFELAVPGPMWRTFVAALPLLLLVHLAVNWSVGLYRQMWRHAGLPEAIRLLLATSVAATLLLAARTVGVVDLPLSVVLLGAMVLSGMLGGFRFQYRIRSASRRPASRPRGRKVLLVGAGEAGSTITREILRRPDADWRPVAVVDDDARKHGRTLHGVPIVASTADIAAVAREVEADLVLLAIPSATQEVVRRIVEEVEVAGLQLKVLPPMEELLSTARASVRDVRDLTIDDLLGRQQVHTDLHSVQRLLRGRRVLITGAGGSIGSEIARQVALFSPETLVLLDHDETHLHDAVAVIPTPTVQVLADIRDADRVRAVFRQWRPDIVFHAAAHKHVPMLELHPSEAVLTNVSGTAHLVDAAAESGVGRFVFVSTDKAVRPTSVMGASKAIGEQIVLNTSTDGRFCAVRFGNVLGSRGSVIPTFTRQIRAGGPVTVTDPRMTRYFMSTPEAVQLVLQAAAFAEGGEIFMLDMGEPATILDLAERMIRLSGHEVGSQIAIEYTGIRPGEKLAEELRAPTERAEPTPHPSIVRLCPVLAGAETVSVWVRMLRELLGPRDESETAAMLLALANGSVDPPDDDERVVTLLEGDDEADEAVHAASAAGVRAEEDVLDLRR